MGTRDNPNDLRTLAARVAAKVGTGATPTSNASLASRTSPAAPTTNPAGAPRLGVLPRAPAAAPLQALRPAAPPTPARHSTLGLRTAKAGDSVMLMPGELYFGAEPQAVKTLLGSCVALTLWHPLRRLGGMCHFLLPTRQRAPGAQADGRFGDEAVAELVTQLERHGCRSGEFIAHLYGGADTMADDVGVKLNVGERNIERGWALIEQYGFTLDGVDVGDNVPRTVSLDFTSGTVDCRRGSPH